MLAGARRRPVRAEGAALRRRRRERREHRRRRGRRRRRRRRRRVVRGGCGRRVPAVGGDRLGDARLAAVGGDEGAARHNHRVVGGSADAVLVAKRVPARALAGADRGARDCARRRIAPRVGTVADGAVLGRLPLAVLVVGAPALAHDALVLVHAGRHFLAVLVGVVPPVLGDEPDLARAALRRLRRALPRALPARAARALRVEGGHPHVKGRGLRDLRVAPLRDRLALLARLARHRLLRPAHCWLQSGQPSCWHSQHHRAFSGGHISFVLQSCGGAAHLADIMAAETLFFFGFLHVCFRHFCIAVLHAFAFEYTPKPGTTRLLRFLNFFGLHFLKISLQRALHSFCTMSDVARRPDQRDELAVGAEVGRLAAGGVGGGARQRLALLAHP